MIEEMFEPAAFDERGDLDFGRAMALANEGRSALWPEVENRLRGSKGLATREALAWLASDPSCRELMALGDDASMAVLAERLAQRGHTVSIESLTRSVRAMRGARLDSQSSG